MSDATEQRERERARLKRHAGLGNLEMLAARYRDHAYALHTHPTYVLGVVVAGVEKLRIGRRHHLAPSGSIIIVNPEEPHDGEKGCPNRLGLPHLLSLGRSDARDRGRPGTAGICRCLPKGSCRPRNWRGSSCRRTGWRLRIERWNRKRRCSRCCATSPGASATRKCRARLHDGGEAARRFRLYRDLIEADLAASLDLTRLAAIAGVTRFQVIRDFKHTAAMTPGQYLRDRRIRAAVELMRTDMPLAGIAARSGFCRPEPPHEIVQDHEGPVAGRLPRRDPGLVNPSVEPTQRCGQRGRLLQLARTVL